jgi:hypothetical protein
VLREFKIEVPSIKPLNLHAMEAPKLPSFFRNVRINPRRFQLKTRHYDPQKTEWENRKDGVEREVGKAETEAVPPREIRFSRSSRRSGSYKSASKAAAYRLLVILIILIFLTYRGLVWLEIWQ